MTTHNALIKLILFFHMQAATLGHIKQTDTTATQILDVLQGRVADENAREPGHLLGLEIRTGVLTSREVVAIRSAVIRRLRNYETWEFAVEELGYLPHLVKAALSSHYNHLCAASTGSTGHTVLMDIQAATARCDATTQQCVELLAYGFGPQQIGVLLKTNGSRLVGDAIRRLSRELEGTRGVSHRT